MARLRLNAMFRLTIASIALSIGNAGLAQGVPPGPAGAVSSPSEPAVTIERVGDQIRLGDQELASWSLSGGSLKAGTRNVALDEVLFIRFRRTGSETPAVDPSLPSVELTLASGDLLRGVVSAGDGDTVKLTHAAWAPTGQNISLDHIRSVAVPSSFANPAARTAYDRRKVSTAESDALVLKSREALPGFVVAIEPKGLRFETDALGELLYEYGRILGARFTDLEDDESAKPSTKPQLLAVIHLHGGTTLSGKLKQLDGKTLALDHPQLGPLEIRVGSIAQIGFRGGRCQFLSDLKPTAVEEHLGALLLKIPFRRDVSVMGTPLRFGRQSFTKGLGVHAYSKLQFALEDGFERFQATIGLDASARPKPGVVGGLDPVTFRVYLDGKKLLEQTLDANDPPRALDVAIKGGKNLQLEVDFDQKKAVPALSRANWVEARIIR